MTRTNLTILASLVMLTTLFGCGSTKDSTDNRPKSFIAPGYVKQDYKKILVLAHVDPDIFRKRIERNVINEFKKHKYNVEGSLEFFKPEMLADSQALRQMIIDRGYDAVLALTYIGNMTNVRDDYYANGNIYNVFYGAYPVFDLDTRSTQTYYFQADFFILGGKGTQWRAGVNAKGGQDPDAALSDMAYMLRRRMQDDKIL